MNKYTPNLNLYKPNVSDDIPIDTSLSENFDKIDNEAARVASQLAQKAQQETVEYKDVKNQIDFVTDLQRMASTKKGMSYEKLPSSRERFKINIPLSNNDGVSYFFHRNANDDFIMLLQGEYGGVSKGFALSEKVNYQESYLGDNHGATGDHNTNPPNYWTNKVGAYIRATNIYGTKIGFNHFADNRGGIWEFTLNKGTPLEQKKTISVYSPTNVTKETLLFENLDLRNHSIEGVFMGADPENPPSSGSARGWIYYGGLRTQDVNRTFHVHRDTFSFNSDVRALYSFSNKEFAVRLRPIGSTEAYRYIPEHESLGTAFNKVDREFLIDGKKINYNELEYAEGFETFQIIQRLYGYHPSDLSTPIVEIFLQHTIKDGVVSVNGKIVFLQPADVMSMSSILTPYFVAFANKIKTSIGNTYQVKTDGTNEFWVEGDKFKSLAFVNDTDDTSKDVVLAVTVDNLDRTYRYGLDGRGTPFSWIEHRDTNIGKIYYRPVKDYVVDAGFEYRFDGRYIVTKIPGIKDYLL